MRILIHGINFAPELTGVGKYTGEMAEWLSARSHEVRVVTAPPYYPRWQVADGYSRRLYSREWYRGARVWRCPLWLPRTPSGIRRVLHLLSFAVTSFPVVLRQVVWRPDVVWVAQPTLFCAFSAWMTARLSRARCWLHIQDYEVDAAFELSILRSKTARRIVTAVERITMRSFDRVSSLSERMLELAQAKGVLADRLVLFPNWVNLDSIAEGRETDTLRQEAAVDPHNLVALYSGTIGFKQGIEILSAAASRLQDHEDLVFVFCGEGPGRDGLELACEDLPNVRFLPLQPIERLGSLLAMADIHLLPQKADAADLVLPSKLTGMLASGSPVVATCDPDTTLGRVVQHCGLITPPGDVEAFVEAIRLLATDKKQRECLGAAGRVYAQEHLDYRKILSDFERELDGLVENRKPGHEQREE